MNTSLRYLLVLVFGLAAAVGTVVAHETGYPHEHFREVEAAGPQTAYPLDTCVVCKSSLAAGKAPVDYIHVQRAKPDRLVRLCTQDCVRRFKDDPAQYLTIIDKNAAEKKAVAVAQAKH